MCVFVQAASGAPAAADAAQAPAAAPAAPAARTPLKVRSMFGVAIN